MKTGRFFSSVGGFTFAIVLSMILVGCGTSPLAPPETAEGPIRLSKRTVNTA
ncbi:MAG: hypothetical protein HOH77_19030, partial [Candidatus Latescibacteria bacterium]|nr:hypothetical protein [Candidatus Latescibacterota bacterium]